MIKTDLYNTKGEKVGKITLPEKIFGLKPDNDLMNQAVIAQQSAARVKYAHVKTRGEVRGGGRKPWAQKHTGQARHGSIRSPLWRKGGVVFGPTPEKTYAKKIGVKKRRLALFMVLSSKLRDKELFILEDLKIPEAKTKLMVEILAKLGLNKKTLISLPEKDKNIYLASRNIPKAKTILTNSLNVVDLLSYKYLLMPRKAVEVIEKTFKR